MQGSSPRPEREARGVVRPYGLRGVSLASPCRRTGASTTLLPDPNVSAPGSGGCPGPGADLGTRRARGDPSQGRPLAALCVAASIPVPRSLWEWQECQGDVNGDIRSHSHQRVTGQDRLAAAGVGAGRREQLSSAAYRPARTGVTSRCFHGRPCGLCLLAVSKARYVCTLDPDPMTPLSEPNWNLLL